MSSQAVRLHVLLQQVREDDLSDDADQDGERERERKGAHDRTLKRRSPRSCRSRSATESITAAAECERKRE